MNTKLANAYCQVFDTTSVEAILAGTKTQTRRVVVPQPEPYDAPDDRRWWRYADITWRRLGDVIPQDLWRDAEAPYGAGDIVAVREPFSYHGLLEGGLKHVKYLADKTNRAIVCERELRVFDEPGGWGGRFMPREACRILQRVDRVWYEWLQDISENDARAEGVEAPRESLGHRAVFRDRWDALNARRGYGWAENPLVRATAFVVEAVLE